MSDKFDGKKCLMLLKLALNRIRLHLQKRTEMNQVMRREVTGLLKEGKDEQARIRTVQLIHGEYYCEVLQVLQIQCETIATRMEVIQAQLSCPLDMKEAVCSVVYAAPFLENSPELIKVRALFLAKYGSQFPQECVNSCCVNKKVKDGLARNMPDEALISYYLSNIQDAHNLENLGDPTESDLLEDENEASDLEAKLPKTAAAPAASPAAAPKKSAPAKAPAPSRAPATTSSSNVQSKVDPSSRQGLLRKDVNGNYWVNLNDGQQPTGLVFIPAKHTLGAQDGDSVICALDARKDSKLSGKIVKVLSPSLSSSAPKPQAQSISTSEIASTSNVSPIASFVQLSSFTSDSEFRQGVFRLDMSGHSWVGDEAPFVFVAPQGRLDAQHGDFVTVQLHPRGDGKLSGHVVSVVQRAPSRKPLQPTQVEEIEGVLMEDEENGESDMVLEPAGDWFMKNGATVIVPRSLASAAHIGDKVLVQVVQDVKQANKKIARVARIIKPRDESFVEPFEVSVKILIDHEGNGHCPNTNSSALSKLPPGSNFVFIPKSNLAGAKHGDKVSVRVNPSKRAQNGSLLGKVTSLLERNPFAVESPSGSSLDGYDATATMELPDEDNHSLMGLADKAAAGAMVVDELDELSQVWDNNLNLTVSGISTAPQPISAIPSSSSSSSTGAIKSERDAAVDRIAAALEMGGATKDDSNDLALDRVLVMDIGSGFIKVGFSDQSVPTFAVPSIFGRISDSNQATMMSGSVLAELNSSPDQVLVGNNALLRKALLQLDNVMDRGVVTNWSIMARLIKSVYDDHMYTRPNQYAVLLTESTLNPVSNREQFARILFQEFKIPALYFARGSVLALNAAGLTTGLVIDLGHSSTSIVPIYEGIIVKHACQRLNVAGFDITDQLARMVSSASGVNLASSSSHREIVRDIKEKLAYVAENPTEERRKYTIAAALKHLKKPYMLPDGNEISLAEERWRCCECLFDPSSLGMEPENGLAHLVKAAVLACDADLRNQMLKTIVLAGGTSLLPGLRTRLERELKLLLPDNQIKVVEVTKRHFSSWIGGSLLVSSPNFKDLLVSRDRYLKEGSNILVKQ